MFETRAEPTSVFSLSLWWCQLQVGHWRHKAGGGEGQGGRSPGGGGNSHRGGWLWTNHSVKRETFTLFSLLINVCKRLALWTRSPLVTSATRAGLLSPPGDSSESQRNLRWSDVVQFPHAEMMCSVFVFCRRNKNLSIMALLQKHCVCVCLSSPSLFACTN